MDLLSFTVLVIIALVFRGIAGLLRRLFTKYKKALPVLSTKQRVLFVLISLVPMGATFVSDFLQQYLLWLWLLSILSVIVLWAYLGATEKATK